MKPIAYYLDEFDLNGELLDREYNGINQFSGGRCNGVALYTAKQIEAAVLAEREACAKVCEEQYNSPDFNEAYVDCADAIRARGEK